MNILYVLNSTYALGGATKSFLTLIETVKQCGHTSIVVAPDEDGVAITLRQMDVEVIAMPYRNNTYPDLRNPKEAILFLPRLAARRMLILKAVNAVYERIKSRDIALVHTNVSVVDVGERVAKRLGIPHIYHIREYGDSDFHLHYYPSSKAFHRRLSHNYTLCITRAIQQHHLLSGCPKSLVVYNGITMTEEKERKALPAAPYFLYAGRIEKAKGLMDLAVAYAKFAKKQGADCPSLAIAGETTEPPYCQKIIQYLEDKGVKNKVNFLGSRRDIGHLMRHATATIVPSHFEGFGRCLPEAMLSGCIVIGRDTAGTKEQLDNGLQFTGKEIGYRFHNIAELSQSLEKVVGASEEERQAMRTRALQTVNEYYTQRRYTCSIIQLYEKIERERNH